MLTVDVAERAWPMREVFVIARGAQTDQPTIMVTLTDAQGRIGRGEGCGVMYAGETPETMRAQIAAVADRLAAGVSRSDLFDLLPAGGARCAVDCALWDLEAKQSGQPAWRSAGVDRPQTVTTAFTIGIRDEAGYQAAAERYAAYPVLKVKVDGQDPLTAVRAVRRGAPDARLIVDPNQSLTVDQLKAVAPMLADLGVVLLEQPVRVGDEAGLDGYDSPILLCADELINEPADLAKARGRFQVINIKLDKTGGLTAGLALADQAEAMGFGLMVGCMAGSSLSMAPGVLLAQRCQFVDLDGPLLQSEDWPDGLHYDNGRVSPPSPTFWG